MDGSRPKRAMDFGGMALAAAAMAGLSRAALGAAMAVEDLGETLERVRPHVRRKKPGGRRGRKGAGGKYRVISRRRLTVKGQPKADLWETRLELIPSSRYFGKPCVTGGNVPGSVRRARQRALGLKT